MNLRWIKKNGKEVLQMGTLHQQDRADWWSWKDVPSEEVPDEAKKPREFWIYPLVNNGCGNEECCNYPHHVAVLTPERTATIHVREVIKGSVTIPESEYIALMKSCTDKAFEELKEMMLKEHQKCLDNK